MTIVANQIATMKCSTPAIQEYFQNRFHNTQENSLTSTVRDSKCINHEKTLNIIKSIIKTLLFNNSLFNSKSKGSPIKVTPDMIRVCGTVDSVCLLEYDNLINLSIINNSTNKKELSSVNDLTSNTEDFNTEVAVSEGTLTSEPKFDNRCIRQSLLSDYSRSLNRSSNEWKSGSATVTALKFNQEELDFRVTNPKGIKRHGVTGIRYSSMNEKTAVYQSVKENSAAPAKLPVIPETPSFLFHNFRA